MPNDFWGKIKKPILALAPMAGITDSAFRSICKKYGADVTYSEMASVSALFHKPEKTLELIRFQENENPYVVQLFGKDPEHFAVAAKIVTERISIQSKKPAGIDINFGCPAKKVFGHGSGCALMPQKELARKIISAVCQNTYLPVSLKIRAGVKNTTAIDFIENTRDLPYSAVMIHGRTYEGGFQGKVDLALCEKIKKIAPGKIILANGGINSAKIGARILTEYPLLDGLGIARGAWGQPWIFQEIKKELASNRNDKTKNKYISFPITNQKIREIMIEHAELIYADKGKLGLFEIRKHMSWYVRGFPGAAKIRRDLVLANSLEEIKKLLS